MTRFVGGPAGLERTTRDAAVGGSASRTVGTGETVAWSLGSEVGGAGTAGAGEPSSLSQSHGVGNLGDPAAPPSRSGFGVSGRGSSDGAGVSQQQPAVLAAPFAAQQGRLQHGIGVATDVTAGSFGVSGEGTGVRDGSVQAQARAGTTAPITVETASKRQMIGRTRHNIGIMASYSSSLFVVNSIRRVGAEKSGVGYEVAKLGSD